MKVGLITPFIDRETSQKDIKLFAKSFWTDHYLKEKYSKAMLT